MESNEHFEVLHETPDFVGLRFNPNLTFRGIGLSFMNVSKVAEFQQFLLDTYGIVEVSANGIQQRVYRKVKKV